MEYRSLGESDLKISVIGFGGWGIGGAPFWSTEGGSVSARAILKSYELGINFFDTAPVYGFGRSEELIGKTLKPVRDKVILATKCGLRWEKEQLGAIKKISTRKSIFEEIDLSLKRLDTEWIDLYQVHWPDADTPVQETMEALLEVQLRGKIRHIGVSNYSVEQMKACLRAGPIVSLQPEYSLLQRSIEKETLPFCVEHHIGIIVYSPLASGVLTGKYDETTKFKDWRGKGILGEFVGDGFVKNIAKVNSLKEIAKATGRTCGQLAINWVIRQKGVATALVGVKNPRQMEENLKALGWEPELRHKEQIETIFAV